MITVLSSRAESVYLIRKCEKMRTENRNLFIMANDLRDDPEETPEARPTQSNRWPGLKSVLLNLIIGVGICCAMVILLLPAVRTSRPAARRSQCRNNLRQIGLALHHYHDVYQSFPPAYIVGLDGVPLHSWRTLILPFLEQQQLYQTIDLSKSWDDPANSQAYRTRLAVYECPAAELPLGFTTYLAMATPTSCFPLGKCVKQSEITDDKHTSIMVLEVDAASAVHWMSPWNADEALLMALTNQSQHSHSPLTHVLTVDGAVSMLNSSTTAEHRRAMISVAGGEAIPEF